MLLANKAVMWQKGASLLLVSPDFLESMGLPPPHYIGLHPEEFVEFHEVSFIF